MKRKLERVESEIAELRKLPLTDVSEPSAGDVGASSNIEIGSLGSKAGS